MKWPGLIAGLIALAVLPMQVCEAQAVPQPGNHAAENRVRFFQRFLGETQLRTGEAVHVDIRDWSIGGGVKLERLPAEIDGLMIVRLRGGALTTIINGKRQQRRENEFWTVPAGTSMALETGDDSAIIETIVIRK